MPAALSGLPQEGGVVHATAVSAYGRALLICGPSGSGKSALALRLMALGAGLIADDRTLLRAQPDGPPLAERPPGLPSAIEARGLGVLSVDLSPRAPVVAVLDLTRPETERLPPARALRLAGHDVALLHNAGTGYFPAALMQYLRAGLAPL